MCLEEYGLSFREGEKFLNRKGDLCNKNLSLNRELICQALNALLKTSSEVVNCLDGNSPCGLMGMLWKKYLGERVNVEINGLFSHSLDVVNANVKYNKLQIDVLREDPCVLLRKKSYDFIFLNCKTSASHYFDSLFSKSNDNAVIAVTTSEDPSLYWQSPAVALRNYGGVIVRTSYFRELGMRLVIAEMVRAAARYGKGITVLCSVSFKTQQSFTIIVKVGKGTASDCLKNIQRVMHCTVCEDRAYAPNSEFALESPSSLLSCSCSKNTAAKTVNELGPVWSGAIFCADFVQMMLLHSGDFAWVQKTKLLLLQILEEARCSDGNTEPRAPDTKKIKIDDESSALNSTASSDLQPSFYFNTHRHHPSSHHLLKVSSIIKILRKGGFRASRTHFDPESVRTNAPLREYIQLLEQEINFYKILS